MTMNTLTVRPNSRNGVYYGEFDYTTGTIVLFGEIFVNKNIRVYRDDFMTDKKMSNWDKDEEDDDELSDMDDD